MAVALQGLWVAPSAPDLLPVRPTMTDNESVAETTRGNATGVERPSGQTQTVSVAHPNNVDREIAEAARLRRFLDDLERERHEWDDEDDNEPATMPAGVLGGEAHTSSPRT